MFSSAPFVFALALLVFLLTGLVAGRLPGLLPRLSRERASPPGASLAPLPAPPSLGEPVREGAGAAFPVFVVTVVLVGPFLVEPCWGGCGIAKAVRASEGQTEYLDRAGQPLALSGGYARYDAPELPAHVLDLAVAVEDRRFWAHPCIDPVGVVRAAAAQAVRDRQEGASTICMQAVRALDREGRLSPDGDWPGKIAESAAALRLLAITRSKARILALYLNHVYFGQAADGTPVHGIEAAARRYFSKSAGALTLAEAATLIGMIQAPARYHPLRHRRATRERRDRVLQLLVRYDARYAESAAAAKAEALRVRPGRLSGDAWLAARLDQFVPAGGGVVATTLDARTQVAAEREARKLVRWIRPRQLVAAGGRVGANPVSAGVLVMESRTGELRAYACGHPAPGGGLAGWDVCRRGSIALASTMKIWLVLFALDRGVAAPDDRLAEVAARHGNLHLRNAFRRRMCPAGDLSLTVRRAFAVSSNCLAVILHASLPADARAALARMQIPADATQPATALGTQQLPISVLLAYVAALQNGGVVPTPTLAEGVAVAHPPVPRLEVGPAAIATTVALMGGVVENGTARRARQALAERGAFAKTGTHENLDVRIVGGVRGGAVAIVWLGHNRPQPLLADLDAGSMLAGSWSRVLRASF